MGCQAGALPADLAGQAGSVQGDQLAAVAGADPAQDQLGIAPGLPGGRARLPAVTGRAEGMAGWVAAWLANLSGVVVEDVAAGHQEPSWWQTGQRRRAARRSHRCWVRALVNCQPQVGQDAIQMPPSRCMAGSGWLWVG
jgi:hypothetical protein